MNPARIQMKLSILIPVYNEEHSVSQILDAVKAAPLPAGMTRELIVVNDGSTDKTADVLNRYPKSPEIKVVHQPANKGKGAAIRRAAQEASGNFLIVQDADLEYDPKEYPALLAPLLSGKADVVYGSRFTGSIKSMRVINRVSNLWSNLTFNLLFGTRLTDINTCYKVFRKADFQSLNLTSNDFEFETEVSAKLVKKGLRILEVPIDYKARSRQEGKKINWPRALAMYGAIIRNRF